MFTLTEQTDKIGGGDYAAVHKEDRYDIPQQTIPITKPNLDRNVLKQWSCPIVTSESKPQSN